jgi:hypothetical protein
MDPLSLRIRLFICVGLTLTAQCIYSQSSERKINLSLAATYALSEGAKVDTANNKDYVTLSQSKQSIKLLNIHNLSRLSFNISGDADGSASIKVFAMAGDRTIELAAKTTTLEKTPKPVLIETELPRVSDLIIELQSSDVVVILDAITYFEITAERLEILKEKRRIQEVITQTNAAEYDDDLDILMTTSFKNYITLHLYYNRFNFLDNISKTASFIDSRSQMINPMSYTSFSNKLDSLISDSDDNSKLVLNGIKDKLNTAKQKLTGSQIAQKIFTVGGNILNLISGGQMSGLFNSIKTITATLFNKNILTPKFETIQTTKVNGQWVSKKILDAAALTSEVNKGLKFQRYFGPFFDKLEAEQETYQALVNNFGGLSNTFEYKADSVYKIILLYNKQFGIVTVEDSIIQFSKSPNILITKRYADLEKYFKKYFEVTIRDFNTPNKIAVGKIRKLDEQVIALKSGYNQSSSKLYEQFLEFAPDFNKPNPYTADHQASKEYDALKNSAVDKYLELIESLDKTLNKPSNYDRYKSDIAKLQPVPIVNH